MSAVDSILAVAPKGALIIIESTVSPGTINKSIRPYIEMRNKVVGADIHLAHAPERILPGNMVNELIMNDRTIGADDPIIGQRVVDLYKEFCNGELTLTDINTAEMSKVVENTFRDVNIAFANELAKICHECGADVYEVIRIANRHPRVNIHMPGPGVGGHCISVDPWFLVAAFPELAKIIQTDRSINDSMPEYVIQRVSEILKSSDQSTDASIGIYGLTYKENTDDVRESPTLQLLESLDHSREFTPAKIYDPYITKNIVTNQVFSLEEFLCELDLVIIMVAHDEIKASANKLDSVIVLDTKNALPSTINVHKL